MMLTRFKEQLSSLAISSRDNCLIAISGGIDSMVLIDLLYKSKIQFSIAHCNFNLRGKESKNDAAFVSSFSKKIECNYFEANFDTEFYSNYKKISMQMAARDLRYLWFNDLLKIHGFSKIITAHHLDDSLETFIINLSRGTGLKGLLGIPIKKKYINRPMLIFSKEEIVNYARKNKIKWREDSTNEKSDYYRNLIRHDITSKLKSIKPNFLENFSNTIKKLSNSHRASKILVQKFKKTHFCEVDNHIEININALKSLEPIEFYLFEIFSKYGFTDIDTLKSLPDSQSGRYIESISHRLIKDRKVLILCKISNKEIKNYFVYNKTRSIEMPLSLNFDQGVNISSFKKNQAYLSLDKLNFPLTIRKWSNGDYFYPTGMDGRKMISKYFKDEKYSKVEKQSQWLLCSGKNVVWVIGKRCDRRFIAKSDPKNSFLVTLKT